MIRRCIVFAALLLAPLPASAAILIEIDKSSQRMTVSKNGERLHTWPVSTGKRGYSTPSGSYKAFRLEKDHFSEEWDNAPMPHSIFFTKDGHAIHGSYEVKRIGTPASHGCVRLAPANAAILFNLVKADGVLNTQVVLRGVEPAPSRNVASAPANAAPRNAARSAPAQGGLDDQAYGDGANPYPRYQERAPIDDPRYAQDGVARQPAYRQPQPYGQPYYQPQQPQPTYGPRTRDPYADNPPPVYYRRGYGGN